MKYTMTLKALRGVWHVQDSDPVVRDLFGTDTLPTPFTTRVSAEEVLRVLTTQNPDKQVALAIEDGLFGRTR